MEDQRTDLSVGLMSPVHTPLYESPAPARRLRISHVVVQPVLVWDDGEELQPGPEVQPAGRRLSELAAWAETLPSEVAALAKKLAESGQQ